MYYMFVLQIANICPTQLFKIKFSFPLLSFSLLQSKHHSPEERRPEWMKLLILWVWVPFSHHCELKAISLMSSIWCCSKFFADFFCPWFHATNRPCWWRLLYASWKEYHKNTVKRAEIENEKTCCMFLDTKNLHIIFFFVFCLLFFFFVQVIHTDLVFMHCDPLLSKMFNHTFLLFDY